MVGGAIAVLADYPLTMQTNSYPHGEDNSKFSATPVNVWKPVHTIEAAQFLVEWFAFIHL